MNDNELLIVELRNELQLELADKIPLGDMEKKLAEYVNDLIIHDFKRLVSLLYRIDVNERKLKNMLQEHKNADAGNVIAKLIIERQLQKIKTRSEFSGNKTQSDSEEKW
jgi:hypothetical protein